MYSHIKCELMIHFVTLANNFIYLANHKSLNNSYKSKHCFYTYESMNVKNWMCELCIFPKTGQAHLISYVVII